MHCFDIKNFKNGLMLRIIFFPFEDCVNDYHFIALYLMCRFGAMTNVSRHLKRYGKYGSLYSRMHC